MIQLRAEPETASVSTSLRTFRVSKDVDGDLLHDVKVTLYPMKGEEGVYHLAHRSDGYLVREVGDQDAEIRLFERVK